ncbi:ABC transporter permease [Microbacterium sp. B19]|uniref:ABC transporter permease n=1 Tax=Microbacterium sp. B19 TaxID=96765 RepID=UPI000345F15B|nr:ABC transporter permease [Microbacterium sp. B19]
MSAVDLAVIAEAPAPPVRRRGGGSGWGSFALRRLGGLALSLGLLVLLTFLIVPLIPGDPAVAILGPNASPDAVAALRERLHLNDPLPVQFLDYLRGLFTFDLGQSFRYNTPVTDTIATKLPYTATTALGAIVVVLLVAIPVGMTIGVLTRSGRRPWLAVGFGAVAGFFASVPAYVAGTLLVVVFAIWLKVLIAVPLLLQGAQRVDKVLTFFVEPRPLLRQLLLDFSLLSQTCPLVALGFPLLLLLHQPVSSEFDFLNTQCMKLVADSHLHQPAELRDRDPRRF